MQLGKLAVGTMVAGLVTVSQAYQTDFHFGMTYWLGIQVGLSAEESLLVASGNEWKDEGMMDARPVVAYFICVKRDPFAFQSAREHHFRATEENPAPPNAREVRPGTPYASQKVEELIEKAMALSGKAPEVKRNGLIDFGGALHGFQDTYAHRGESQVPIRCDANLAWTHPKSRNGDTGRLPNYLSTNADHTHRWPKDCVTAARESYNYLRTFVARLFPERKHSLAWSADLEARVDAFCKAETKSAKVDWLKDHGVPQEQAIAQGTSLDDGKGTYQHKFGRSVNLGGLTPQRTAKAEEARRLQEDMERLARKLEKPNATAEERRLLERYLQLLVNSPAASLPEQLAALFGQSGVVPADDLSLIQTQRLRFVDRGLAAHDPIPLAALATPAADIATMPDRTTSWQSMYVTPLGQSVEQPYVLGPSGEGLVAFALLRHAPYEVVRIEISRKEKLPHIAAVEIVAMH